MVTTNFSTEILLHSNTTARAGTRRSMMINLYILTLHIKFCSLLGAIGPKIRQKYGQGTRHIDQPFVSKHMSNVIIKNRQEILEKKTKNDAE